MTKKQKIVYIYLLLLPFVDVITALTTRFTNFSLSLGMVVKGLTMLVSTIYIFGFSKSKWRKKSMIFLCFLFVYFILFVLSKQEIWNFKDFFSEMTFILKYYYFIVMLLGVVNIFDDFKIDNKFIKRVLFITSLIYAFLLLFPLITNTSFNSYSGRDLKGENGWFFAANETGTITILLLLSTYFLLDDKNKKKLLLFIPILFSITFIGTKVSYLGMILAIITIIIFYMINNKKKGIVVSTILITILLVVCSFSPAPSNLEKNRKRISKLGDSRLEEYIHNKDLAHLIEVSLNGREDAFLNDFVMYLDEDTQGKLFGLGWTKCGKDDCSKYDNEVVEIDYLDVYFHYGLFGFILYLIPILYVFIDFLKKKKTHESYYYFILLGLGILISSLAGHNFSAPAVSVYIILIIYMLKNSYTFKINEKEITIMSLHMGTGGIEKYLSSLCLMLENDYKINIISTYKLSDTPSFKFNKKINIKYLINRGPNEKEFKEAVKNKNIIKIFKEGIISAIILYKKKKLNKKAIKKIQSKYIITTREFHSELVGKYANESIIKIATEHNYHNNNKKYYNNVIKSVKGFDYFVLVSKPLLDFYKDKVGDTKCIYIPNTIDNLPNKETKLNKDIIYSVGRLERVKGFDDLIDVIDIVKKKKKNIKLYLIGDGSERESLENKIKKLKLEDNIILKGLGTREMIEECATMSKLYVMTSHSESFGIVLIEAMSYKVPCIAFDSASGAKELLKNDVGVLIKNRDKNKMANEIISLLDDNKKLKKYSENGYNECQKYLIENVKKEWLSLLN